MSSSYTRQKTATLVHLADEVVQLRLPVASITVFNVVVPLLRQTTKRATQLERPQEVVGLLEVWAHGVNLVH
jgi:hypothetical protein